MTKVDVLKMVEEGYRLDSEIKAVEQSLAMKEERLDTIKNELKAAANGKKMEISADGCKASISFPPVTPRYLDPKLAPKAKKLAGPMFGKLFCLAPVKGFTDVVKALLGDDGEKLVELVAGGGNGRISFDKA